MITKTKAMKEYQFQTGKNAIWQGKETKGFVDWKNKMKRTKGMYHAVDGLVSGKRNKVQIQEKKEPKAKPQVVVRGYPLELVDKYIKSYLGGQIAKSSKEKKLHQLLSRHFKEDNGRLTLKSKHNTLSKFF